MKGLRTYSERPFGELFAPLFDHLRGHAWLTSPDSFHFPAEWVDASEFDDATERHTSGPIKDFEAEVTRIGDVTPMTRTTLGFAATTNIFPRFAAAVSEDWCSLYAIAKPVADPRRWFEDYYATRQRREYLAEHVDVVFLNVDASFWECFAQREDFLNVLRTRWTEQQLPFEPSDLSTAQYL